MSFYDEIKQYSWAEVEQSILNKTEKDVLIALNKERCNLEDFKALISPAAEKYIEQMAAKARQLTMSRFGKTIQMYVPLYVSNYCSNSCVYCGFSAKNKIVRKKLSIDEVMQEIEVLKAWGFKHILLVSGESNVKTNTDYYKEVIKAIRPHFSQISLEVQPLDTSDYKQLVDEGLRYVCVYQETYNEEAYPSFHPRGRKADYKYRLETPDRCGQAGMDKIGIGALLGLQNWRTDSFFTALHLSYLEKTYWRTRYSISLPRLRPHVGSFNPEMPITDLQMAQLICAYRLFNHEVDISLSTRESSQFRDMAMHIGVTTMSAASSTEPGGYVKPNKELEQFSINDGRSVDEMADAVRKQGYEPVWKDWDTWL